MALDRSVLSLRFRGLDPEDIAESLGISTYRVKCILDKAVAASADAMRCDYIREAELSKLEEMEEVFLPKAIALADDKAAAMVLRIMERRASLTGLDKQQPQQINVAFNLVNILADMSQQAKLIEAVAE